MSIDEILDKYAMAHYAFMEDVMSEGETIEQQKDQAKQALYKDMVEIIGENEELKSKYIKKDDEIFMANRLVFRNQLRQELRTKLKEYYGIQEVNNG